MSEFRGVVERIVFRSEGRGWTVISLQLDGEGSINAVGEMPFLQAGDRVRLSGELVEHASYGRQIAVKAYELLLPETKSEMERYLGSGLIRGIGEKRAKRIVEYFGAEAMSVLESHPERLTELPGIGPKRAAQIAESFAKQNGSRLTMMFLLGLGLSTIQCTSIYTLYGDKSEAVIRSNPYRLVEEMIGVGFQTADGIARQLGFSTESAERLCSGLCSVLRDAANHMGHSYLPEDELVEAAGKMLNVEEPLIRIAMRNLQLVRGLIAEAVDGVRAVYLPSLYDAERDAARLLTERLRQARERALAPDDVEREIRECEAQTGVSLSELQREAVACAVGEGVSIITGGPGTGKTTSINCILRILEAQGKVELCAPTGRAAKHMAEATEHPASTIHRLLGYFGDEDGFQKNEEDPVDADAIVVDEMSMVDIFLLRSLLRALRPGAKLVMVGDADQLPSVGAGNVLRDLIASGALPVVRLTEIFRQSRESCIVVNAHRINRGEYPIIRNRDTDFFLERRDSAQSAAESVVTLARDRLPRYLGVDSLRGIQVMAPMHKGPLGVDALNRLLQEKLNPPTPSKPEFSRGERIFRLGDKVMQIRNDYRIEWMRGGEKGKGIFNGDIGYIAALDCSERRLTVEFDDGRRAEYDEEYLGEMEHSYCISVHKSQGSEFDAVVLPLLFGPPMLMTRNLLYTAVTRARRLVVIVGREDSVWHMVENNHILKRYSALAQRLAGAKAQA